MSTRPNHKLKKDVQMINVVQIGLGPLGIKTVQFAIQRGCFNFVGAVDINPAITGKDLGTLCGLAPLGVTVKSTLAEAIAETPPQVAILTTVSSIEKLAPQVREIAKQNIHIVSTCEELFYPYKTKPQLAEQINEFCQQHSVTCLGTGVNPGFLMDFLPTVASGVCQSIDSIEVSRIQDASIRRIPFQQKIGAGLTLEQFEAKKNEGTLRHVGLPESVDFLANRLGFNIDRNTESLEPVIAEEEITTGYKPIQPGMARGVQQIGRGFVGDKEVITLKFRAAVGEPQAYDEINIKGDPPIHSRITGGVNGDTATCAITLNAIRSVLDATPGLKTMADIPPVAYFNG